MRAGLWCCGIVAAASLSAQASVHDFRECQEGGTFIRNAALARDAGMSREAFVARMTEDLVLIRAFPAELRWFARDENDERLLLAAAHRVFDAPAAPADHEGDFLVVCTGVTAERDG